MVELDKTFNPDLSGTEIDENLEKSLPLPIYDAFKLLEKQENYDKSLQILCLSLIPWTFQYLALILSGEYLASGDKPDFEVNESLLNMVKKPGPGKWLSFIRSAVNYFIIHKASVIPEETILQLKRVVTSEKPPLVKVQDNENKLDYSGALIYIRNRFAHSRIISTERAKELFNDYFIIWKAWLILIKQIFDLKLLYKSSPLKPFQSFDHRSLDLNSIIVDKEKSPVILCNPMNSRYIRLYPVIVTYSEIKGGAADVAFLEEIKSKYLFYLQGENFFKLKDEFFILSEMIESKMIVDNATSAQNLTLKTFNERIERITNHTLTAFNDSLKYIPEMYIDRPLFSGRLDTWLESDLPGCIVTGDPGVGKTSLLTNWCIRRKALGDHILLIEASNLKVSDITSTIENDLNLSSSLKDCLDSIREQSVYYAGRGISKRLIIIVDAVNEFTGKTNENRCKLWREINSLIGILDLYKPTIKCLITTRNDLWSVDFPGKNSVYDILKEKLYWSDVQDGFPHIILSNLTISEAKDIFENARKTIPFMAVKTPFNQLTNRTKKLLCNPFLMRLALMLYNEKEVPALTRAKLEKQYLKENIREEENKKKVLFTLLERMAELRKTEVTFDELVYSPSKKKTSSISSLKERKSLERLILDPRPKSVYKKLLSDGIIEERTDSPGLKSKEMIRFSQEKIIDIMYPEFLKKHTKRIVIATYISILLIIIVIVAAIFATRTAIHDNLNEINKLLSDQLQDEYKVSQILELSSPFVKSTQVISTIREGIESIIFLIIMLGNVYYSWYSRSLAVKIIKIDLPSRFIREKFTLMKQKKWFWGIILFGLIILIYGIKNDFKLEKNQLISGIPIMIIYITLLNIVLGVYTVVKNANSPLDAFCLFGKSEVKLNLLELGFVMPLIILIFLIPFYLKNNPVLQGKVTILKNEWLYNEEIISLQSQNPVLYSDISNKILGPVERQTPENNQYYSSIVRYFMYCFAINFVLILVLQYYIGFWLYKFLKRRL